MARITLNGANKVNVRLNRFISYVFDPSTAAILSVKVREDHFKPDKMVDILNSIAGVIWQKDNAINAFQRQSRGYKANWHRALDAHKRLKKRLFVAGLILLSLGGITAFILGV